MSSKNLLSSFLEFVLPKKKATTGGKTYTNTFKPGDSETLSLPEYQQYLDDIQEDRLSDNEFELIDKLFINDPDCSAALNAYLTLSDTPYQMLVYNKDNELDRDGIKLAEGIMTSLFSINDYSLNYQMKPSFREFKDAQGWLQLARGAIGAELVYDKAMRPYELRIVDMATIKYTEKKAGQFKPIQKTEESDSIDLDIPTFFTARFRQSPTTPYSHSHFAAAINTIAARMKIINDLYRIMNYTGYPRIAVSVVEEILLKNAPKAVLSDDSKKIEWINARMNEITSKLVSLQPTSPIVHTDSAAVSILNEKMSGASLQVSEIIECLNAQNQAGLKVVATVLGRGTAGVNTASTETIIFSKSADAFNRPMEDLMSRVLTLALRIAGFEGYCEFRFEPVELRPALELENQKTMLQTRMLTQLSYGLITDDEYHLRVNGELAAEGAKLLSGTNFLSGGQTVDTSDPNANRSSLNRELTPDNETSSKSNSVQPDEKSS